MSRTNFSVAKVQEKMDEINAALKIITDDKYLTKMSAGPLAGVKAKHV